MTEVSEVASSDVSTIELDCGSFEKTECLEIAMSSYQNPGVNSGLLRMKEEGAMMEVISPQICAAKQKMELAKKLDNLAPLMKHEYQLMVDLEVLPLIVGLVAPYDPALAQSYADRLEYDNWTKAYIEISKQLSPEEAQLLLNQVKRQNSSLILVCHEEFRRGLSEREQTLERIKTTNYLYDICDLAELLMDFQLEIPSGLIERAHQKEREYLGSEYGVFPDLNQYGLLSLLKVEARAESPLTFETLRMLRENTDKIRGEYLNDKEEDGYNAVQYIEAWGNIIEAEAAIPFLSSELEKNLSFVLDTIKELKMTYPDESDEFDLQLLMVIKELVSHYPSMAMKVLNVIDDDGYHYQAIVDLIKEGHPNKQVLIQKLIQLAENENEYLIDKQRLYIDLSYCIALVNDVDQALPYLEKAKSYLSEIDSENYKLQMALCGILEVEIAFHLPNAKQTLEQLHQVIREASDISPYTIPVVVKAELSLLIATFSKECSVSSFD